MGWCTAQFKTLPFSMKTIVKESHNSEIACLKKKKKESEKKMFWPFGDFLVRYFHNAFHTTGSVVRHESTQR